MICLCASPLPLFVLGNSSSEVRCMFWLHCVHLLVVMSDMLAMSFYLHCGRGNSARHCKSAATLSPT